MTRFMLAVLFVGAVLTSSCGQPAVVAGSGLAPTVQAPSYPAESQQATATARSISSEALPATPTVEIQQATPLPPTQTPTPDPTAAPTPIPSPTPTPVPPTPTVPTLTSVGAAGQTQPVPILMYHYVRPNPGPSDPIGQDLSVTPADFVNEMQYLQDHHYTTMTLGELADVRAGKLKLPAKPVVITFDDGYRDFYTTAWPVLKQHHFKATIFLISGFINQPRYMTWDMVRELDASGYIEVGAHTVHHLNLAALSPANSWAEIDGSKVTIEKEIGHSIRSFCYPSGRYSQRVVNQVKKAGFTMATTTNWGFSKASDNPLLLPRVRIHGTVGLPYLKAALP